MELFINENVIKLIIFDLDGTFYSNSFYEKKYFDFSIKTMVDLFGEEKNKAINILSDNGVYAHYIPNKSKSLTDFVLKRGISLEKWNDYRDKNFIITNFLGVETVKIDVLYELKKQYGLYLVTNNTKKSTNRILDELCIKKDIFRNIYTSEDMYISAVKKGKEYIYSLISEKERLQYKNMLSVGDRYSVDILPLLQQGGSGILVKSPSEISMIKSILDERR